MKRVLMNASVASMIYKFNMNNIQILMDLGYQVDVACNFGMENPISQEQVAEFKSVLKKKNIIMFPTSCPRSIFALGKIVRTYKELKKLAKERNYNIVHTQSPIGGVVCRLAFRKARKRGTKIIYQAHGFHFYKGAPIINWLIYYPIEVFCSRFTDVIITINKEDFEIAKKKMHAKRVEYVPGVGVDLSKFGGFRKNLEQKRVELGIPAEMLWVLSVGELTKRKNHRNLIKAVADLENVFFTIAGQGELEKELKELIEKLNIGSRVKLLGFRTDISDLCEASDLFAFPSYQEGLPVALMEAMASGKPVICSRVRGNVDLVDEGKGGFCFNPNSPQEIADAIRKAQHSDMQEMGVYNRKKIEHFNLPDILSRNWEIYDALRGIGGVQHLDVLADRWKKRESLGVGADDFLLLSVGELNNNKNHAIVIEALRRLDQDDAKPVCHYAVAGKGILKDKLEHLSEELHLSDRVHFLGFREDVADWYHAADIFVFPSKREGLSVSLMEAMAAELPCVVSRIRGNMDLIDAKKGGYLFESDCVGELAMAIENLFLKDLKKFGIYNRKKVSQFSLDSVLTQMREIYENV